MKEHTLGKTILFGTILAGWCIFGITALVRLGKRKCRKSGNRRTLPEV
ncbi:hypothetical protein [Faecalibaculum rodentium]|jgi:hypothetical protein|nr:hypothetical protein [Faecalibaculum rodentium]